jgi:phenylpropionate dioxygenase-like ring-hydroxylating dioxygenase large terminal subunit
MPVSGGHIWLEAAEKKDRKIDALAKIELPPEAATPADRNRAAPYHPPSAHHDALGSPSQRDFSFRAQNYHDHFCASARTSAEKFEESQPPGNQSSAVSNAYLKAVPYTDSELSIQASTVARTTAGCASDIDRDIEVD